MMRKNSLLLLIMLLPATSWGVLHDIRFEAIFNNAGVMNQAAEWLVTKSSCYARLDELVISSYTYVCGSSTIHSLCADVRLTDVNKTITEAITNKIKAIKSYIDSIKIWHHRCNHDQEGVMCPNPELIYSK